MRYGLIFKVLKGCLPEWGMVGEFSISNFHRVYLGISYL